MISFHKIIRVIIAVCFVAAVLGLLYLFALNIQKKADKGHPTLSQDETYSDDDETPLDYDKDAKWREAPIFIDDIDPNTITTTAKLHEVFDRFMLYSIPTVEIQKLPADFPQMGDANLYIKAVLPVVMRENQKIAEERAFLTALAPKIKNKQPLTPDETVRFEELTRKYDTFTKKLPDGQLAELLEKVDVVPNSLAIAQMGIQTNWGTFIPDSPFGQRQWVDGKYDLKKFNSLPEATASFMLEINSMPQYHPLRVQRGVYRKLRGSLSARLIDYMQPFEPENPTYVPGLKNAYRIYNLGPLDNALFWK